MAFVPAVLVACGGDDDGGSKEAGKAVDPDATIDMREYEFTVSGLVPSGRSTIEFVNSGDEAHMASIYRLQPGKTVDDVVASFDSPDDAAFNAAAKPLADEAPGGLLWPGDSQMVTTDHLEAGDYVLLCFIPTVGSGQPHTLEGMVAPLEVSDQKSDAPEPVADVGFTIADGHMNGPTEISAGRHTIEAVARTGTHELLVANTTDPTITYAHLDRRVAALFGAPRPR